MGQNSVFIESLPSFAEVVANVQAGHPDGLHQLYRVFLMLSGSLRSQFGFQNFEDRLHDTFIVVVEAIREGKLREPGALPSYIHGIARLTTCSYIGVKMRKNRLYAELRHRTSVRMKPQSPEDIMVAYERNHIMQGLLRDLSWREREIITRFYLQEQTKEQICDDMSLTETQFRLAKSRAKQRLARMGSDLLASVAKGGAAL